MLPPTPPLQAWLATPIRVSSYSLSPPPTGEDNVLSGNEILLLTEESLNCGRSFACCPAMALEAYDSLASNTVPSEVLSQARQPCYK
ncbi:hypothetical protein Ancab_035069, partial [Ancistrocladus abbreviatus]